MSNPADRIGKAKGSITVAGASDINKYPDNVGDASSGGQHYMLIKSYKMNDPRMTTGGASMNTFQQSSSQGTVDMTRPVDWACALYIPPGSLKQAYAGKYSNLAYGGAGIKTAAITQDLLPSWLGGTAKSYTDQWNQLVNKFDAGEITKEAAAALIVATGKGKQALAAGGVAPNQHMSLVYEGPGEFREHTFSFTFWPKNHDSANQVEMIIKNFKKRMLPGGTQSVDTIKSAFWGYPNLFTISFFVSRNEWEPMRIYRSVLQSMTVDYMGAQGTVAFHTGNTPHPVATKMDLTFKETIHVTNEDVEGSRH